MDFSNLGDTPPIFTGDLADEVQKQRAGLRRLVGNLRVQPYQLPSPLPIGSGTAPLSPMFSNWNLGNWNSKTLMYDD